MTLRKKPLENLKEKNFFRESNIWRLIGGLVCFVGIVLMIIYPSETYQDVILYRTFNEHGFVSIQITVWHFVIVTGMLGFIPTLKELLTGFFKRGE